MRHLLSLSLPLLFLACGGSVSILGPDSGGGADGGSPAADGSVTLDVFVDDAFVTRDAARDVGADMVTVGRVPLLHRPSGSACPMQRGPGMIPMGCDLDAGMFMVPCTQDTDCTMGTNGRCIQAFSPLPCQTVCSYDGCFGDSDCMGNIPCDCRASATDSTANVCRTGSNCRVDADCGPNGYCSPSSVSSCTTEYFCHTPNDACIDDSDCGSGGQCNFDPGTGAWKCGVVCFPPP